VTYRGWRQQSTNSSRIREWTTITIPRPSCAIASGNTTPTVGNLTRTVSVDGSSTPPESRRPLSLRQPVCSRMQRQRHTIAYDSTLQTFLTAPRLRRRQPPAGMTTSTTYYGIGGVPGVRPLLIRATTVFHNRRRLRYVGSEWPDTTKYVYDVYRSNLESNRSRWIRDVMGPTALWPPWHTNVSESSRTAQHNYFDGLVEPSRTSPGSGPAGDRHGKSYPRHLRRIPNLAHPFESGEPH